MRLGGGTGSSSSIPTGIKTTKSTTDAAITTIDTVPIPTDTAVKVRAELTAKKDDVTEKAGFEIVGQYANNSGVVTLQGAVNYQHRQVPAGWDVTFVILSPNVLIRVVGNAATNIDWKCNRLTLGV